MKTCRNLLLVLFLVFISFLFFACVSVGVGTNTGGSFHCCDTDESCYSWAMNEYNCCGRAYPSQEYLRLYPDGYYAYQVMETLLAYDYYRWCEIRRCGSPGEIRDYLRHLFYGRSNKRPGHKVHNFIECEVDKAKRHQSHHSPEKRRHR